jgi:hypothetical protein
VLTIRQLDGADFVGRLFGHDPHESGMGLNTIHVQSIKEQETACTLNFNIFK